MMMTQPVLPNTAVMQPAMSGSPVPTGLPQSGQAGAINFQNMDQAPGAVNFGLNNSGGRTYAPNYFASGAGSAPQAPFRPGPGVAPGPMQYGGPRNMNQDPRDPRLGVSQPVRPVASGVNPSYSNQYALANVLRRPG